MMCTLQNAKLEGVEERVEIIRGDARQIPFVDNSFDYIVSNLCLQIYLTNERAAACREIMRVLKPEENRHLSQILCTQKNIRMSLRKWNGTSLFHGCPHRCFCG
jgi:ubiquinone/menaquinone biosynthesis C-methylase UbiE